MEKANGNDKLFGLVLTLFGILAVFLVAAFLFGFGQGGKGTPDFRRFVNREPSYHAQFAQACEALLRSTAAGQNHDFVGSDSTLGPIILQLHPRVVRVERDIIYENDTNK